MYKTCTECGKEKHITQYHKTSRKYNGMIYRYHHAKCRGCRSIKRAEYHLRTK